MSVNLSQLSTRLTSSVDASQTLVVIKRTLLNPAANPRLSMLLLAIAVVSVLLVLLAVLLVATPSKRKVVVVRRYYEEGPAEVAAEAAQVAAPEAHTPGRIFLTLTSPLIVGALVLLAAVALYVATSTNSYCAATCHAGTAEAQTGSDEAHARCVECHERGRFALISNVASRSRMVWRYSAGIRPTVSDSTVDSRRCQACHSNVAEETVTSSDGLRMSHKEVAAAGTPCLACHPRSGHGVESDYRADDCLPCHDSRTASAKCTTCHDPKTVAKQLAETESGEPMGSGDWQYPAVRAAANGNCGACHDQPRECDGCHGIRMPHTEEFIDGGHAVSAAFERKLKCWRCHDPQFCSNGNCHNAAFDPQTGDTTHGSDWKREHQASAWDAGCVCHQFRTERTKPICTLCHDEDGNLLAARP